MCENISGIYKPKEEFLKNYNPNEFERSSVTADILIFGVLNEEEENYLKADKMRTGGGHRPSALFRYKTK